MAIGDPHQVRHGTATKRAGAGATEEWCRDESGKVAARGRLVPGSLPTCGRSTGGAVDWARIDRCLVRFDAGSLAVLLGAATDSPGAGHRLPSLTVLWLRCLARPPTGTVRAVPAHLPQMLAAARAAAPQLRVLED